MDSLYIKEENFCSLELVSYIKITSRDLYNSDIMSWQYGSDANRMFTIKKMDDYLGTQGMLEYVLFNPVSKSYMKTMKSETTYVSGDLRGTGKFEELYNYAVDNVFRDNYDCVWGFTALIKVWRTKLNFIVDENFILESTLLVNENYHSGFSFAQHVKFVRNTLAIYATKLLVKLDENSCQVNFSDKVSDILKNIGDNLKNDKDIRLDYNSPFFKNRVDANPKLNYKIAYINDEANHIVAFLIFNINNGNLYISDVYFDSNSLMKAMFYEIAHYARSHKLNRIKFFGNKSNSINREVFAYMRSKLGIVESNIPMTWVIKFNKEAQNIDYRDWRINGLWTEGFTY